MQKAASYGNKSDFEKVLFMFRETDKKFQETDKKFQETKDLLAKSSLETDRMFQETKELLAKSSLETDRKFQETDKKFQETKDLLAKSSLETDRMFKETDKKLNKLEYLFTSQWGKLMESLVEGDLVRLLNEKGINVKETYTRVKGIYEDKQYEFDIIAENGIEVVVVEVKTTLSPKDINEFIANLKKFKKMRSKYTENIIYGAVAFLITDGNYDKMAEKKGLFTIRATGNSASFTNAKDFKPKKF